MRALLLGACLGGSVMLSGCSFLFSTVRDSLSSTGEGATLGEAQHGSGSTVGGSSRRPITCGGASSSPQRRYTFVAPRSAVYVFDSRTSDYDGVLAVWDPSGNELACNDDHSDTRTSQVTVALTEGQAVEVIQGGYSGASGHFDLWVTGGAEIAAASSSPAAPQPLPVGHAVTGDTRFAAAISGVDCPPGGPMQEWLFTPAEDGSYLFAVEADYDAYLAVVPEGSSSAIACNDDTGDTAHSQAAVELTAGAAYRVIVGGFSGRTGTYSLTATALSSGGALTLGQPILFAAGTTDAHPDVCGAPAGSVDRTFAFRPPAEAFYVIHTNATGWLVVNDGHRTLACVAIGSEHRVGLALKSAHRYDIVLELGSGNAGAYYLSIERTDPDGPEWQGSSGGPTSIDFL